MDYPLYFYKKILTPPPTPSMIFQKFQPSLNKGGSHYKHITFLVYITS